MLPQLAGLYKKYESEGFHLIGLECQGSDAASITDLAKSKGVTYQLTTNGDLKGSDVRGIPHGFLFGPDGKMIADDPHGAELETKIKELLKETSAAMAGPGPYTKLAGLAAQVKAGQGLGTVLKTLRAKKDSKDEAEAKEAQMMYEALSGSAQSQLDKGIADKASDPVGALKTLDKVATMFAGDEIATKAKAEAETLRKDPAVKKEVDAQAMLKTIETMNDQLKPFQGQKNPASDGFRKANAAAIQGIVTGCKTLTQRFPGTQAAKAAEEMMNQFR